MPTGKVLWYDPVKGYGFIAPDDGGPDLFVHHTGIQGKLRRLSEGQAVEFEIREVAKGKLRAEKVRVLGSEMEFNERPREKVRGRPLRAKAHCPACRAMVELPVNVKKGSRIECPECGELLRVVKLSPLKLDYDFEDTNK